MLYFYHEAIKVEQSRIKDRQSADITELTLNVNIISKAHINRVANIAMLLHTIAVCIANTALAQSLFILKQNC